MKMNRREALAAGAALSGSALLPRVAGAAPARTLAPVLNYLQWLGPRPNAAALRDRVVLVDVFTFACENCRNITPNLRALHRRESTSDFAIIGIHTPETPYERDPKHVIANLGRLGITWPVAIDNDSRLWDAYGIEYWPTQLIFDRTGTLRKRIVGDSQDAEVNATIASLLNLSA
jgi:thiol-disulfide isomerase/thioredoxin